MRTRLTLIGTGLAISLTAGCGDGSTDAGDSNGGDGGEGQRIALLLATQSNAGSVAVSEGVQEVADADGVQVDVFDATFDPQRQFSQMQDAITTGNYDGILIQPIDGSGICSLVSQAAAADIAVGAVNSAIGADYTSPESDCEGVSASAVRPFADHGRVMGELTVQACESVGASPCEVGFLRTAPGAPFDEAIFGAFEDAISGSDVEIVAEGNSQASREGGLTAIQQMLAAQPGIDVLAGPEQSLLGGLPAVEAANLDHEVLLAGVGGTTQGVAGVEDGTLFGTSFSAPRSEGEQAMRDLLAAIESGEPQPGVDVVEDLPEGGQVTSDTVSEFTPEFDA